MATGTIFTNYKYTAISISENVVTTYHVGGKVDKIFTTEDNMSALEQAINYIDKDN